MAETQLLAKLHMSSCFDDLRILLFQAFLFLISFSSLIMSMTGAMSRTITSGDHVILYEYWGKQNVIKITPGQVFGNQFGTFHHDDMIGKPYGSKVRQREIFVMIVKIYMCSTRFGKCMSNNAQHSNVRCKC